jgi:glucose-1-phosphate thymidylyltransferase
MLIICPIAGVGSRLHPLTITKPKAMIKIAGSRIMDHLMEKLKRSFPKRTKICFIVGYKKKSLAAYITDNYSDYFDPVYVEQTPIGYKNEIPYYSGLGDAVGLAAPFGKDDDCFIFLSDRLPIDDYTSMLEKMKANDLDGIINVRIVKDPQHYGVCVINEQEIITRMVEKPKEYISNLAVSGAYCFSKRITGKMFEYIAQQAQQPLAAGKERQFTPIIHRLIQEGAKIGINVMEKPILDFGRIGLFLEGNQYLLNQHPNLEATYQPLIAQKKIERTQIIPPVYIGKNCTITSSVIGPNVSIGDNVIINKCVLENCVIGDCSSLDSIITENSVIGDFVTLDNLVKNNISIGDSSTLASTNNL